MYKRLFKTFTYHKFLTNYPKFRIGSFFVSILCVFLIIIATFTQIPLNKFIVIIQALMNPSQFFSDINSLCKPENTYYYISQVPIVLFIGAFLGQRIAFFTVLIYIIAGLIGFPVFASGGGINYFTQQSFGYILGFLISVLFVGKIMSNKVKVSSILRAAIVGVLIIHIVGISYLTILLLFKGESVMTIIYCIGILSGKQLPYDLLFSIVSISLGMPARSIFWLAMD